MVELVGCENQKSDVTSIAIDALFEDFGPSEDQEYLLDPLFDEGEQPYDSLFEL